MHAMKFASERQYILLKKWKGGIFGWHILKYFRTEEEEWDKFKFSLLTDISCSYMEQNHIDTGLQVKTKLIKRKLIQIKAAVSFID